ncbi:MAG: YdcF family protein [Chakrabartia godavariana]
MIRRLLALLFVFWFLGLVWFAVFLPGPTDVRKTDAVVVLTGGTGRFERGLATLEAGKATRMLVSGVDPSVRREEFEVLRRVPPKISRCCIDLDKASVDTISNARETARWVKARHYRTVRLVTSDWHMRRAKMELDHVVGPGVEVIGDAVRSNPSLTQLFKEYNKLVARFIALEAGERL